MALHYQLDLFADLGKSKEQIELDALRADCLSTKQSADKVRKSLFAKNGELTKRMTELEERLIHIERGICQQIL